MISGGLEGRCLDAEDVRRGCDTEICSQDLLNGSLAEIRGVFVSFSYTKWRIGL